jgi:hypothetical protein
MMLETFSELFNLFAQVSMVFFRGIGLSLSEAQFDLVLFSRKHTNPSIYVSLNGRFMPVVPIFRYIGVVFDGKLLWGGTRALHPVEIFQEN